MNVNFFCEFSMRSISKRPILKWTTFHRFRSDLLSKWQSLRSDPFSKELFAEDRVWPNLQWKWSISNWKFRVVTHFRSDRFRRDTFREVTHVVKWPFWNWPLIDGNWLPWIDCKSLNEPLILFGIKLDSCYQMVTAMTSRG